MKVIILFVSISIFGGLLKGQDFSYDLKASTIYLLKLNFDQWKGEIDSIPNGFDDYAQQHTYDSYISSISELEAFMKDEKIKFQNINDRKDLPIDSNSYLLDYKLKCTGGKDRNSGWMCSNGFFFRDLKTGDISEYLGTVKVLKTLKKKLKKRTQIKSK